MVFYLRQVHHGAYYTTDNTIHGPINNTVPTLPTILTPRYLHGVQYDGYMHNLQCNLINHCYTSIHL